MTTPPSFPAGAGMVTLAYDLLPSGTTFNPPATIRIKYDQTLIPASVAETDLQIAYYDSSVSAWSTVPVSSIDTTGHFIYAQIGHFTPYAVTYGVKAVTPAPAPAPTTPIPPATTTPPVITTKPPETTTTTAPPIITTPIVAPRPATFEPASLIISPSTVKPGETVSVSLKITNTGDVPGTDIIGLRVNNLAVESKDITLAGGVSTVVTFTTSNQLAGKYTVTIAGLNGDFTVSKNATPGWFWLVAAGAFVLGIILAVGLVLLRERKT
jgi:hypothetical protein